MNQDNVSILSDMSTRGQLLQSVINMSIQLIMLDMYKADIIIISWNVPCCPHDLAENDNLALNQTSYAHHE